MDLIKFKHSAARKKTKLKAFLTKLDELVPNEMPQLVKEADAQVWQEVDCTACANCCKIMTPTFSKSDIVRVAADDLSRVSRVTVSPWSAWPI